MPPVARIKAKPALISAFRKLANLISKRKAFICRRMEMKSCEEEKSKSFINNISYKMEKITKNNEDVFEKLYIKVQKLQNMMISNS